jgi:hypothetical protein
MGKNDGEFKIGDLSRRRVQPSMIKEFPPCEKDAFESGRIGAPPPKNHGVLPERGSVTHKH